MRAFRNNYLSLSNITSTVWRKKRIQSKKLRWRTLGDCYISCQETLRKASSRR